jgi:hypothetical protein
MKLMGNEMNKAIDQLMPICLEDLRKIIAAASNVAASKSEHAQLVYSHLIEEAISRTKAPPTSKIAEMVIVLANLTSIKGALEATLDQYPSKARD